MNIDVGVGALEQAVFVPVGLANPKDVTAGLHVRHVRLFPRRVVHHQQNVDDRLCGETEDGRRSDVFDHQRSLTKQAADAFRLAGEQLGPAVVVGNERDRTAVHPELSDGRRADLFLAHFIASSLQGVVAPVFDSPGRSRRLSANRAALAAPAERPNAASKAGH